jgi:hypothetical protein
MLAPGRREARGVAWGALAAAEGRAIRAERGGILGGAAFCFAYGEHYAGRVGACALCFWEAWLVLECPHPSLYHRWGGLYLHHL